MWSCLISLAFNVRFGLAFVAFYHLSLAVWTPNGS